MNLRVSLEDDASVARVDGIDRFPVVVVHVGSQEEAPRFFGTRLEKQIPQLDNESMILMGDALEELTRICFPA